MEFYLFNIADKVDVKQKPKLHNDWIHPDAYDIVEILQSEGFETYLVGGCVRDLLAGIPPKDFDIATNALPNQVRRNISNAYVIGKRFRLVLVKRGPETFEVATFRRAPTDEEVQQQESAPDDAPSGDNFFGNPEDDAKRRDFTINSMFYDPVGGDLLDFCQGRTDIENRLIRTIGEPGGRMVDDPIRILRSLRLAHKLKFRIEPELRASMQKHADTLVKAVLPRRREEYIKIMKLEDPALAFVEGHDLGLWEHALPFLNRILSQPEGATVFFNYLERIPRSSINMLDPGEILGSIILATVRAMGIEPGDSNAIRKLEDNEEFMKFCKFELGAFNLELRNILSSLALQRDLESISEFEKRGRRRQSGFLRNESFPLALRFSQLDFHLSPSQIHFWSTAQKRVDSQSESSGPASASKPNPS
jgi:poly(A) polymerase